jgi:hypothetical protein
MDDDTFKSELYNRMSTAEAAADTLWVISGSIEELKEKLNPGSSCEQAFSRCMEAIGKLAETLETGG